MGTLSSFIPSRLFICAKLTQILRKNNYIFRDQMFLSTRVYFRMQDEKTFLLPRGTQKEPFYVTFFFFLFFILARYVRFFPGTRPANWNIKSAYDDVMRRRHTRVYHKDKKRFSLSLSLLEESVSHRSFCSFFVLLIRGSVL